jgi:hypothetical protein
MADWSTVCVMAANNLDGIDDATFSVSYRQLSGAYYQVYAGVNQSIAVSAPNYQTTYVINPGDIYLTYIGAWPQTY